LQFQVLGVGPDQRHRTAPDDFIANMADDQCPGYWIRLTANEDGSFSIVNGRNGFTQTYSRKAGKDLP
jgi:hypothetical protein